MLVLKLLIIFLKAVSTGDLVKMARFVLEKNYFEFNCDVKKHISGTAIGTMFPPPYACIFMDELETRYNFTIPISAAFGMVYSAANNF